MIDCSSDYILSTSAGNITIDDNLQVQLHQIQRSHHLQRQQHETRDANVEQIITNDHVQTPLSGSLSTKTG